MILNPAGHGSHQGRRQSGPRQRHLGARQQAATKPEGDATATLTLRLTPAQIAALRRPHLLATWEGAWDVTLNGAAVKQVRYSLPHTPAGWHLPQPAV